jgi:hypothetical protein
VSRRIAQAAAATLLAALLVSAVAPATAAPDATSRRVVVLFAPHLTWSDVSGDSMPRARALAERALLANMNVRAGAAGGTTTSERGALVLSAGASVVYAESGMSSFDTSESVGSVSVRDFYRRLFALDAGDAEVAYLGLPLQASINVGPSLDNSLGALGTAVRAKGYKTAAIGNGDPGWFVEQARASRPAGVAAADGNGIVDLGDVSPAMLKADPVAPFGVLADISQIAAAYKRVLADPDVRLVVVDPGDIARADLSASMESTRAATVSHDRALQSTDEVLGVVVDGLMPGDVVVLMAPAAQPVPDAPEGFSPLLIAGPDGGGVAAAASTHRDGIVTAMDVSATIVDLIGAPVPSKMVGSIIHPAAGLAGAPLSERADLLDRIASTAIAVESVRGSTVNTFILLTVIALLVSTLILYRGFEGLPSGAAAVAKGSLLLVPSVLLGSIVQFAVWRWPSTGLEVIGTLLACTAVIWVSAMLLGRGRPIAVPLIVVTGLTAGISLVDQWLGAPLSFVGLFGYSPLLGARYYGLGNEMSGLLLGSALVAVALALDTWRAARWTRHIRTWGWPVIGLAVLATAAAPFWGANVGAVAWMTVGFLVGWLMLNGRKVWTWRNLVIIVALVVLMVAGLSAIDLLGGAGSETHLGRAITAAVSDGPGSLWTLIARKAETNVRVLGRTNWTWLLVAVLLLLGYMRWRPRGEFAAMLKGYPAFSAAVAASLFAGIVGYFTEDSGIIIPALLLIPVGVAALYLMLGSASTHGGEAG